MNTTPASAIVPLITKNAIECGGSSATSTTPLSPSVATGGLSSVLPEGGVGVVVLAALLKL